MVKEDEKKRKHKTKSSPDNPEGLAKYRIVIREPDEAEQGQKKHGPRAKGIRTVPPRKSTGQKGIKTNLPTDEDVDNIYSSFLEQAEDSQVVVLPSPSLYIQAEPHLVNHPQNLARNPGPKDQDQTLFFLHLVLHESHPLKYLSKRRAWMKSLIVDLLNALCLTTLNGTLVYGPSYAQDADILRTIVWDTGDSPPILPNGAPAFLDDSVLMKAWKHSNKMTLSRLLVFHYDPQRVHWLLFEFDLIPQPSSTCYEPLQEHQRMQDIQQMRLLAQFFSRHKPSQRPEPRKYSTYEVHQLDIQRDGDSCGFWMVTIALMLVCEIDIVDPNLEILENLAIDGIKQHWRALITSWRIEEEGLGVEATNNFLQLWDIHFPSMGDHCLAARPDWIPRFDPVKAAAQQAAIIGATSQQALPPKIEQIINVMGDTFLRVHRDQISAADLGRFLHSRVANDELMNTYIAALNYPMCLPQAPETYIGSRLRLPLPDCDYLVLTTFFYPKFAGCVAEWKKISTLDPMTQVSTSEFNAVFGRFFKWFKENCLLFAKMVACNSNGALKAFIPEFDLKKWKYLLADVPPQTNGVDCGFYVLTGLLHLLCFNGINAQKCPPALRIQGATMSYTRLLLAAALINWVAEDESDKKSIKKDPRSLHESVTSSVQKANEIDPEHPLGSPTTATTLGPAFELKEEQTQSATSPGLVPSGFFSPVPSSADGELEELSNLPIAQKPLRPPPWTDPNYFATPEPRVQSAGLPENHTPPPVTPKPQSRRQVDFPFSCRCGKRGDGHMLADGLDVVQCAICDNWSHIACQRYGRDTKSKHPSRVWLIRTPGASISDLSCV
ncbi:hypothetical protein B0H11DRAFT_1902699 [Mycena galericulata]|nr:hypothetical protein B0H11DRAFT_1902699 [Mycena galericulata]